MISDLLKSINWVDFLVLVIAVRIVYISAQTGFVVEFLKGLAALAALFVSFHYYIHFAKVVEKTLMPPVFLGAAAFLVLWLLSLLVCKFIRDGFLLLFTVQEQSALDKWGAVLIASGRVVIVVSMVMFLFLITGDKYLRQMTLTSLSGKHVLNVAPWLYRASCDRFVIPLFPGEKKNPAVREVLTEVGENLNK